MNIQDIYVSACRGAFDRNVYDVRLIDWLENVRPQIPLNDYAKKQLPAIMPHGLFGTRRQDTFKQHSGIVQIDIDGKHQNANFDLDKCLMMMQDDPWLVAGGKSCGGNGLYMLYMVQDIKPDNHAALSSKVIKMVEQGYGVVVDVPVSVNKSSLRFASPYAPYINFDVKPLTQEAWL